MNFSLTGPKEFLITELSPELQPLATKLDGVGDVDRMLGYKDDGMMGAGEAGEAWDRWPSAVPTEGEFSAENYSRLVAELSAKVAANETVFDKSVAIIAKPFAALLALMSVFS